MIRAKFLLLFLMVSAITVQAQSLKGKLVDLVDNKPLAGATLKLTGLKDSTLKFNVVSDSKGFFEFKSLPVDSFMLQISFIGYENFKQIVATKDSVVDLGLVSVPKQVKQMGEVVIIAKAPPTQQKGDTTQFSADQFKVNPDATTEDLIKKMPGITVDKDGTVTAQGDQVKKVTVDGRDFFGDDATAALRNLPSAVVDKIQVFDKLSDQAQFTGFDDGNSVKAINIVTKSAIKNGQFGRIYAGYGTNDRYSAGGNVSFFKENRRLSLVGNFNNINQQNFATQDLLGVTSTGGGRGFGGGNFGGGGGPRGGPPRGGGGFGGFGGAQNFSVGQQSGINTTNAFGLNYSDKWSKKLDVTGSYFFNNSNNSNDQIIKSQTLFSGKTQYADQDNISTSKNYNNRINMRIEYRIDSSNSFIIIPNLNFQNNKSVSGGTSQTYYGSNDTLNTSDNNTRSNRNGYNLGNTVLFRHSFAKRGRTFSVNLNTTFNKNDGESYVLSHYRFFNQFGIPSDSLQDQYITNPTNGYYLSSNFAYTEPIGKKSQLQINYTPSYSKNKADQETYSYDQIGGKYSRFDTLFSNKFNNTTTTNNGGITFRRGASRDNQFAIGVSFQHSKLESERIFPTATQVNQSFTTVLPNFMWMKKISPHSNIRIFYRASTSFPTVTQLQDVVTTSNPLQVSSGNPALKQSNTNFLSGRYIFTNTQKGQSFFANIFIQSAQNYISNATFSPTRDSAIQQGLILKAGSQLSKPVNLNGYKSLRSFLTFSQPVKFIKSNINLNGGFTYSRLPGLINNVQTVTNNYVYSTGVVIASNISEYVDFNLSYSVNFNNTKSSVQGQSNNYVNQSTGFQMNLLTKSGWFLQNDLSNQTYSGLSAGLNQSYWLWNASIGKKFLKNKEAELKLSGFDLLKQNQSLVRTVSENYIQDTQTKVLQQYFMLTFTYSLKNFGKYKPDFNNNRFRREMPMF
ncbi:MAG TPA: outer membrane beta-barrel protein [Chitinophagaceae bacterium]|nr:outer membrane beta-barrel protein [Chitinophagaceae bacterium]